MSFDDLVKQWDGRCDLTLVSDVERAKVQWLWRDRTRCREAHLAGRSAASRQVANSH